jgi:hypothetical protein
MRSFDYISPRLQELPWPPVSPADGIAEPLSCFLNFTPAEQQGELCRLRSESEAHSRFLHQGLGVIYSYVLGYPDSPCHLRNDDELEMRLLRAKVALERELSDWWLRPAPVPDCRDQREAARHLQKLAETNVGVNHPLFDYLAARASRRAMEVFLLNDVVRNEVVDDEVALLVCGLQGLLKSVCATNLWDEVGRAKLTNFHTYWLRRLLGGPEGWEQVVRYRRVARQWFAGVTSNVFMMLLTRPALKLAAYGHFLITEGWVPPHFDKILEGMRRTGFNSRDEQIYFEAHVTIDPMHTDELIQGVEHQVPSLSSAESGLIIRGANYAVAGATVQYDRMLSYLQSFDNE